MRPSEKHKGSELDTNQKMLTDYEKRYYPMASGGVIQLEVYQQIVIIDNQAGTVIALPSVAEAKGISYDVTVLNNGNAITLTDSPNNSFSDSSGWESDYTLDAADDRIVLRSDGSAWSVITNAIAE